MAGRIPVLASIENAVPRLAYALLISASVLLPRTGVAVDLAAIATAEADAFQPVTDTQLEESREALLSASKALETALSRQADGGDGWRSYLKWEAIEELSNPGAEIAPAALQASLAKLNSGAAGLELPVFRNAANSLRDLLNLTTLQRAKDQPAAYRQQVAGIAMLLKRDPTMTDPRVGYQLERRLDLVAGLGQAPKLEAAVRDGFDGSNVLLTVSETVLDKLVRRPVNTSAPIRDTILGARVVGTGETRAWLSADLKSAQDAARLDFSLSGSIHSETTGYKGPVAVRSSAETPINAVKSVRLRPEAFLVMPASTTATTSSKTRSIRRVGGGFGSGLIERLASGRVEDERPQADRIASGRAAAQVSQSLDKQVDEAALDLRRQFDKFWTKPLARYGATPARFRLSSTERTLDASLLQAGRGQLGADTSPPETEAPETEAPDARPADALARVHPSAVHNLATSILGGSTIKKTAANEPPAFNVTLPDWLERLLPEESPVEPAADASDFRPWSLTLRRVRPISVAVLEDAFTVTVHAAELKSGDSAYRGWDLILRYRVELVEGTWRLRRQGEIEVLPTAFDPASGARLKGRQVGLRRNLAKAVNDGANSGSGAPGTLELLPIDLSGLDRPGLSWLAVRDIRLSGGWLTIAWDAL